MQDRQKRVGECLQIIPSRKLSESFAERPVRVMSTLFARGNAGVVAIEKRDAEVHKEESNGMKRIIRPPTRRKEHDVARVYVTVQYACLMHDF